MIKKLFKLLLNLIFCQKTAKKEIISNEDDFDVLDAFKSSKAKELNIDNTTKDKVIISNIKYTIEVREAVFEILKEKFPFLKREDLITTSFYRCEELNNLISKSKNSDHKYGKAFDFVVRGLTLEEIWTTIKYSLLQYDQLILEKKCIHLSCDQISYLNRNMAFIQ